MAGPTGVLLTRLLKEGLEIMTQAQLP